ncbi:hypothetical protein BDW72DRAFT_168773 [Aspergillus terricola var. indicus]
MDIENAKALAAAAPEVLLPDFPTPQEIGLWSMSETAGPSSSVDAINISYSNTESWGLAEAISRCCSWVIACPASSPRLGSVSTSGSRTYYRCATDWFRPFSPTKSRNFHCTPTLTIDSHAITNSSRKTQNRRITLGRRTRQHRRNHIQSMQGRAFPF